MFTRKVIRHIFIPAAAVVAEKSKTAPTEGSLCKPSELPIYTAEEFEQTPTPEPCSSLQEAGAIEQAFGTVRRTVFSLIAEIKSLEKAGESYLNTGMENATFIVSYLQEEDNTTPKYGAIAVGGLAGLIFGLRGGFIRKTIYTTAGALSMAALCYPKEASEYSQIGITEAKRFATIAYNFVNGVKKDDPPLDLPSLPNMPTSISEAWDVAKNIGKSTKSLVTETKEVQDTEVLDELILIDPLSVVTEAHDVATTKSCHCPIGACMGHHEEIASNPENQSHDSMIPLEIEVQSSSAEQGPDSESH